MVVEKYGDEGSPLLVCVHGLMGHPSDFNNFKKSWSLKFQMLIPHILPDAAKAGYSLEDAEKGKIPYYENSVDEIADYLRKEYPNEKIYFAGISQGGKIILELAGRYPDLHGGSVLTDVGLGPLCNSEFYTFLNEVVMKINLNQPWEKLREDLSAKVPDRMLRLLVQSHIGYESKESSEAFWKSDSLDFPELVQGSIIEDQLRYADTIDSKVCILKATSFSAINDKDYEFMKTLPNFKFIVVDESNHFIQINQPEVFEKAVLDELP